MGGKMNTETNTIAIPRKVFREIRWHLKHFNDLDDYIKTRENPDHFKRGSREPPGIISSNDEARPGKTPLHPVLRLWGIRVCCQDQGDDRVAAAEIHTCITP